MTANKYTIRSIPFTEKQISIPIEMKWDLVGQEMAIGTFQEEVIKKIIGEPTDFEVDRFSHQQDELGQTKINYEFYFYSGGSLSDINNWTNNYISEGFSTKEIYYYSNAFSNSFFKLDFYDTPQERSQINYLTIILPTQQGLKMSAYMQTTLVEIKKPKFVLDYVGDVEGFFIYWLKNKEYLNLDTFYMTAKFYNAKRSGFTKMMNKPQSSISGDKFYFDELFYFYYQVKLNYLDQTYQVIDIDTGKRVGTNIPIKWYEYVNP